MEENIALDSSTSKEFKNAVSGIKELLKSGKIKLPAKTRSNVTKEKLGKRGVIYIGHIPHGFYEKEMRAFFKQFGKVTKVRVSRSKKNGRSKGYGYVEFEEKEVAEIAAETMNNYLMDKRLLKAELMPESKNPSNLFKNKNWVEKKFCPGIRNRKKYKAAFNKELSDEEWMKQCKQQLKRLKNLTSKLDSMGINFSFMPSDIPENLDVSEYINTDTVKNETKDDIPTVSEEKKKNVDKVSKSKKSGGIKKPKKPKASPSQKKKILMVEKTKSNSTKISKKKKN